MNVLQQIAARKIEARGGTVFSFDKSASLAPILSVYAQKKLERMRRYGSRKVKVAVRRNRWRSPVSVLTVVLATVKGGRHVVSGYRSTGRYR